MTKPAWIDECSVDNDFDGIAWDCSLDFEPDYENDYDDLDDFDDSPKQHWQVACLDRFGDRLVNGRY
jgi:hypothetical protein